MSQSEKTLKVDSAALSDRGLNEKRPLNEDAFLADSERCIFAVADGVGGAEAGEVASQTAIEVLDEAFRHQVEGADIEDLMELAIQRANASIHQMAQEHARFSMMATTIVALHLKGNVATIGHVGDSRLYRFTPSSELVRETEDHSVVEEEVRAGRMTREQAANHPSKNVISRALGAEDSVEVDLKTIEFEEGTEFLLCSDGITRHVSDAELRQLLATHDDLTTVPEELKKLCYERGAEDNLTVVVVRGGDRVSADERFEQLDPTVTPEKEFVYALNSGDQQRLAGQRSGETLVAPSRIAFPAPESASIGANGDPAPSGRAAPAKTRSSLGRFFVFLLFLAAVGAAFYGGTRYKGPLPFLKQREEIVPQPLPTPVPVEDPLLAFEKERREVDRAPTDWLTNQMPKKMASQGIQSPLESSNPEFLYLYGRALLLAGNADEAGRAFEASIAKANLDPSGSNATVKNEATLGLAALTLKSFKNREATLKHYDEMLSKPAPTNSP